MYTLSIIRLVFDSGLLILIWMTQLIVYPSFKYYSQDNLLIWHQKYTFKITVIVLPLMLGQLIVAALQILSAPSFYSISTLLMIMIIWLNTFLQAIPLHQKIDDKIQVKESIIKLIQINWIRTFLWTTIFISTCVHVSV